MQFVDRNRRQLLAALSGYGLGALPVRALPQAKMAVAPRMARGVNIHHTLNWPEHQSEQPLAYRWPPFSSARYVLDTSTLTRLRSAGLDFVRLTFDPAVYIVGDASRRADLRAIIESRIRSLLAAGLNVVFDFHPVRENPAFAPTQLIQSMQGSFGGYLDAVESIAGFLQQWPHDRVCFELMNEPLLFGPDAGQRWAPMLAALHGRARRGAPTLPLVITAAESSSLRALSRLDTRPFQGSNVIYTFHYYDPLIFTHQGVDGVEPARFVSQLPWPPMPSRRDEVSARALSALGFTGLAAPGADTRGAELRRTLDAYFSVTDARARITTAFTQLAGWARREGVDPARVLLGEFGVVFAAGPTSRAAWLSAVRQEAEANGFPWAVWALKGEGGMALQDERTGAFDPLMLASLGLKN